MARISMKHSNMQQMETFRLLEVVRQHALDNKIED